MALRNCLFLMMIIASGIAWCQPRQEISLNGAWQYVRVAELTTPPEEGWLPIEVPGTISGVDYQRAWFRREFTVPQSMTGRRLTVHFGGVKFNSTVYINGQEVGGHFGGYDPFDVDITAAARVGETNRLDLACHDWTGVFSANDVDFSVMQTRPTDPRDLPRDRVLAPIGGLVSNFGPWDDVELRAHPAVYVKDLFIKPSVRNMRLRVEYTLANLTDREANLQLGASVEDAGQQALELPAQAVTVPAQGEATAVLEAPWPEPRFWSHEDPYLYFLRTVMTQDDAVVDDLRTRFGFREFWVEGSHFILNGKRVNLLATSWWPELSRPKEYIQERIRQIKNANCVIFRTHTQPWSEIWYETADEMGLMMIPEGAVWNDDEVYRLDDQRFWDNYATHLKAMVDRDKNKPSVVMYSLENEFYGSRINDKSPAKAQLVRLGELMKQWDPTRPIFYESDGDPGGVADVIGIHYPHEYPEHTDWPNTAYWMDTPKSISWMFTNGEDPWLWDRSKPVYVGEFLWVPSSDPSWHTVFYGDDAYLDYDRYRVKAKGDSWRMAIQAYRYYEVGGISPWTMVEGGPLNEDTNAMYAAQKYAMQHIAAYIREYDHNFYSGEQITRTADVYNDVLSDSELALNWALVDGEQETVCGEMTLQMKPGERREVRLSVNLPTVDTRTEMTLRVRISRGGETVFEDSHPVSVFPPLRLTAPEGTRAGLFDPGGKTAAALEKYGVNLPPVADLDAIPDGLQAVVVGAGALSGMTEQEPVIGLETGARGLTDFVRAGGKALVLEQPGYTQGVLPALTTERVSTMTFPQVPEHPLLRGVKPNDLKWWRPDNYVSLAEPARPEGGAARAVVVSGSRQGIAYAPLCEYFLGDGALVLSQLRLVERLDVEPAAGLILQNALDYLAVKPAPASRTALFAPDAEMREYLDGLGLQYADITQAPGEADWAAVDLLVACPPLEALEACREKIGELLARGGTVLLHGVAPDDALLPELLGSPDLALVPHRGGVVRQPGAHALSSFLANEDLYWLGESRAAHSWATRPLADDMADFVFAKTLEGKQATEYPAETMTVEGPYTAIRNGQAIIPSGSSTASVDIQIPADGAYILGVVAGGSPALGVYPTGTVSVDGRVLGAFSCQDSGMRTYTVSGELAAGTHRAVIRFTNDYNSATEDRNLIVEALKVAADDGSEGVSILTNPGALAVIERGGGRVVVDNINWAKTERESRKASRYISGLLTGLGARFEQAGATVFEAETFEPQPGISWFRREAGAAYMGSSGWIAKTVRCAQAGRYQLRLTASGTPVKGIYPIIRVEIGGEAAGEFELKSESWRSYSLPVELPEGVFELRLVFTNDEWAPPEDRNLRIDKVEFFPVN
ncbi:MAG: hypothetical protein HPY44_11185 [Armatimonadetes bacterium]|nr:hypothetical protein [Armatimonadota bacterium]